MIDTDASSKTEECDGALEMLGAETCAFGYLTPNELMAVFSNTISAGFSALRGPVYGIFGLMIVLVVALTGIQWALSSNREVLASGFGTRRRGPSLTANRTSNCLRPDGQTRRLRPRAPETRRSNRQSSGLSKSDPPSLPSRGAIGGQSVQDSLQTRAQACKRQLVYIQILREIL